MLVYRPVAIEDVNAVFELVQHVGFGMTSLPADKPAIEKRILHSQASFDKTVTSPGDEKYFFVLEDTENKQIIGTSAIDASIGNSIPAYWYKLSHRSHVCHELSIKTNYESLHWVSDLQGCSEIGSLFLHPDYRKDNNGVFLSKIRFLFMTQFANRFADIVIAEMRGVSDDDGMSPFWESVGRHFFDMDFFEADKLSAVTNKQFIADLMPAHPIYVNMLSDEAKEAIGKPHASTVPALKILTQEGFRFSHYVDIFDAGPTVQCHLQNITSVKNNSLLTVEAISDITQGHKAFIANTNLDFRAMQSQVVAKDGATCHISKEVAENLNIAVGDKVRVLYSQV